MKKLTLAAAAALVPVFLAAPALPSKKKRAPFTGRYFAHRGLHDISRGIPENSIAAFRAARDAGYGIELDVQLSRDGKVAVFHDDSLKRVCGVDKKLGELDMEELRALRLLDTDHRIPLFSEVLETVGGKVPLIVELKTAKNYPELCAKTLRLLKDYSGDWCAESFDPRIVGWFRIHAPRVLRGQLAMPPKDYVREGLPRIAGAVLGNCLANFISRPDFIAYREGAAPLTVRAVRAVGAMDVAWTAGDRRSEGSAEAIIFEGFKPPVRFKKD